MTQGRKPRNMAALRALLEGDEKNFVVAQMPGGIEAQEAMAQQDLIANQKLPKEGIVTGKYGKEGVQRQMEAAGFVFGAEVDDLFISCQFPQGWSIKPTDHSMWSYVYDGKGRQRMSIFYKGAFYDRNAHASIERRFHVAEWYAASPDLPDEYKTGGTREDWLAEERCMVVKDYDGTVLYHTGTYTNAEREKYDEADKECEAWLKKQYPDYENPFAYWD